MRIDVITIFPEMFSDPMTAGVLGRARQRDLVDLNVHDLRDFTSDRHRSTDDYPYGGGVGMVMKPEPIFRAVESMRTEGGDGEADGGGRARDGKAPLILMTPQGRPFTQSTAWELSRLESMILLCGRYEGVDERVRRRLVDREISIGDYVLSGGELPAMVVIDAIARLIPGVLGDERSRHEDSFQHHRLEGPQYTRPEEFRGLAVPEILLSGHHEKIARWRLKEALRRTLKRRPDLLERQPPDAVEEELLAQIKEEEAGRKGDKN